MRLDPRRLPRSLPPLLGAACAVVATLCLPASAAAQWKWRAPSGVIQYSDQPPPADVPSSAILARPAPIGVEPPSPAASSAAAKAVQDHLQQQKAQQEAEKQAKEQAQKLQEQVQAQQRAQICEQARQRLVTLDSGRRVRQTNDQGQMSYFDSAQLQAERDRTQALVDLNCR